MNAFNSKKNMQKAKKGHSHLGDSLNLQKIQTCITFNN